MSRRARAPDSDEPNDDPEELNWSGVKQGRGKYKRKRTARGKAPAPPPPLQTQNEEPSVPAEYLGDPTEMEVIENVRALPDIRSGGKVIKLSMT